MYERIITKGETAVETPLPNAGFHRDIDAGQDRLIEQEYLWNLFTGASQVHQLTIRCSRPSKLQNG
jgi:hypothetical protein